MVRLLPAVLLVGLGVACASPTLPLPPPSTDPSQMAGADADHVTLVAACGSVPAEVYVQVINLGHTGGAALPVGENGTLTLSSSCGSYTAFVYAHTMDRLEITYQEELQISTPQYVTVGMP